MADDQPSCEQNTKAWMDESSRAGPVAHSSSYPTRPIIGSNISHRYSRRKNSASEFRLCRRGHAKEKTAGLIDSGGGDGCLAAWCDLLSEVGVKDPIGRGVERWGPRRGPSWAFPLRGRCDQVLSAIHAEGPNPSASFPRLLRPFLGSASRESTLPRPPLRFLPCSEFLPHTIDEWPPATGRHFLASVFAFLAVLRNNASSVFALALRKLLVERIGDTLETVFDAHRIGCRPARSWRSR